MRSKGSRHARTRISYASYGKARAVHVKTDDGRNVVGIGNLRVVIMQEGSRWIAQGLEIDYTTEGTSLKDVQSAFAAGLRLTIREHCRIFGNVDRLLKIAPAPIWKEFMENAKARGFTHSQIQKFREFEQLPFPGMTSYVLRAA